MPTTTPASNAPIREPRPKGAAVPASDDEAGLEEVRKFVYGEGKFSWIGKGITTYKTTDPDQQRLHGALLELERRGLVQRHHEEEGYVV